MKMLKVLALGIVVGGISLAVGTNAEAAENKVWTPRTVEQIKADIAKVKGNKYTIVWGDTLSAISGATNITVQKLADMNKIANVDLIYAGNTLVFEGNVATVQNKQGETIAQTVIQPKDKNDASKPVGKQEPAKQATDKAKETVQNKQGTTATSGKVDTNSQGTSASSSGTNSSTGETVAPGNVETPAQPSKPATPSQPADNQPIQPSKGEDQGGSTKPTTLDTTPINMGNSGKVFDSEEAASEYGYAEIANEKSPWYGYRFGASQLVNKDYELLGTWTVDFTENKRFDWNN